VVAQDPSQVGLWHISNRTGNDGSNTGPSTLLIQGKTLLRWGFGKFKTEQEVMGLTQVQALS